MSRRVAIQGFAGSFHEEAARRYYGGNFAEMPRIVECSTFDGLYKAMEQGVADCAIMAIENTISGGLLPNFELLRKYSQKIKGEIYLHIHQNLMALPGQKLEDIREVRSHYMAINRTREFCETRCPWMRMVEAEDTAKSAADLAEQNLMGVGAVASKLAAQMYGLEILEPEIETFKTNFTRFLILDDAIEVPQDRINKASICFTLPHKPGSLAHILTILSFYDMNLTRVQSLPIPGRQWQYFFYIDIRFEDYERYQQALSAVRPLIDDINILGEYPSAS